MKVRQLLTDRIRSAFDQIGLDGDPLVQAASRPEFGDYQANGIMGAAKRAQKNPRECAQAVLDVLDLKGIAEVEIAGPGFLNITLLPEYLEQVHAAELSAQVPKETVVVDYSAPNLAKEMHVGHLRSTIIGDAMVRALEAIGHHVIRQNHVGDWGTQFGMLLTYLNDHAGDQSTQSDELADLEDFYRAAKQQFDSDEDFKARSREAVVGLQSGDPEALAQWQRFIDISMSHCQQIYDQLGVTLSHDDIMGESAYNPDLPGIIERLNERGLLQESEGAACVFLEEFKNKAGDLLPVIVQKSDGGYLYATTDLAAASHRANRLGADRVVYFTDARQSLHFKQIFAVAKLAGLSGNLTRFEHMPHGAMLGNDGKPFKTRDGGVVKLSDLLDEAEQRATQLVAAKNPDLDADTIQQLGQVIGIGAIKYAELSKNRTSDYVFDWSQMISFEGNTAPYLQYAYTRIQSIFAKGEVDVSQLPAQTVSVEPAERRLAAAIAGFEDVVNQVADEGYPHYLCGYLFELANRFTQFYEACPILNSEADVKQRRLVLAAQTAKVLKRGLDLLGIGVVDQM